MTEHIFTKRSKQFNIFKNLAKINNIPFNIEWNKFKRKIIDEETFLKAKFMVDTDKERRRLIEENYLSSLLNNWKDGEKTRNIVINKNTDLSFKGIIRLLALLDNSKEKNFYIIFQIEDQFRTYNFESDDYVKRILRDGVAIIDELSVETSDYDIKYLYLKNIDSIKIFLNKRIKKERKSSGFFKYTFLIKDDNCCGDISLDKYGIFKEVKKENYNINCLYRAFKESKQFEEKELNYLKTIIIDRRIPFQNLKQIAEKFKCTIYLRRPQSDKINNKDITKIYNKNQSKIIHIGSLEDHYFINNKTNFTSYSIEHYNDIKNLKGWNKIEKMKKGKPQKSNKRFANSYKIIKLLIKNKEQFLKRITLTDKLYNTQFYDKIDEIENLDYDEKMNTIEIKKQNEPIEKKIEIEKIKKSINNNEKLIEIMKINLKSEEMKGNEESKNFISQFKIKIVETSIILKKLKKKYENLTKIKCKIFFDIESTTKSKFNEPYLCSALYCDIEGNMIKLKSFVGKNCIIQFLKTLDKDSLVIMHNAGYDARFLLKYLYCIKMIEKGKRIMSGSALFYNINKKLKIKIFLKDSLSLISMPLRDFGDCFKLKKHKDILPYDAYNEDTVNKKCITIKYALKFLKKKKEKKDFIKNINTWKLRVNQKTGLYNKSGKSFNHLKYSKIYCEIDCKTLHEGYEKFRGWMKKLTKFDIDDVISIASLSYKYLLSNNCFEGCCKLSGIPREFIQKTVVGGRVMVKLNQKSFIKSSWNPITGKYNDVMNDFDAVSLYPSAMAIMGFLKGKPKIIINKNYENIKNYDGYFVQIKINKIEKRRHFPLISYIGEKCKEKCVKENEICKCKGIRHFCDDIKIIKNKYLYVDKTSLEDLIKYQKIKFEIIRGYYFNEGFNYKIKKIMKKLFNERLEKKKEKNPIQIVYKLIMNTAYGKTIQKPITTNKKIFNNKKELDEYLEINYNRIKYYKKLYACEKYMCKVISPINEHFSFPQIGSCVLSMSKRIMNEVITLAQDLNINIFYQDTDSMHIMDEDIKLLSDKFEKEYNRKLIGKNMGQFHCDFNDEIEELKNDDDNQNKKEYKADKVHSIISIFLGKKSYMDYLELIKDGKKYYKYHIRMKGIPSTSIIEFDKDILKTYKKLFKGEKIKFDLLAGDQLQLKFNDDYSISRIKKNYTRTVHFPN